MSTLEYPLLKMFLFVILLRIPKTVVLIKEQTIVKDEICLAIFFL